MNESRHIRISHRTYEWVSTRMNKSRHIWMSDVLYRHVRSRINTSRRYCADLVISACLPAHRNIQEKHIWMSHFNRSVALPSCWQPWYTRIALIIRHILFIFINRDVCILHTHITYTVPSKCGNCGMVSLALWCVIGRISICQCEFRIHLQPSYNIYDTIKTQKLQKGGALLRHRVHLSIHNCEFVFTQHCNSIIYGYDTIKMRKKQ